MTAHKYVVACLPGDGIGPEVVAEARAAVDAACAAIAKATGVKGTLVDFHVASVTGGTDALGDVTVRVEVEGKLLTGRGVASDIVEASARAYLQAVNKFVQTSPRPLGAASST